MEDPQFTFSGDKRESIHNYMQSTEMNQILPKGAAALFASMENQDEIDLRYLM